MPPHGGVHLLAERAPRRSRRPGRLPRGAGTDPARGRARGRGRGARRGDAGRPSACGSVRRPGAGRGDARRLLDLTGHGRAELWRAAADAWRDSPLLGQGAGTYARSLVERTGDFAASANAHSLYLETLAELGVAGLVLLLAFVALTLLRAGTAAVAAAAVAAWAVHAAVDWTWQLPAATLPAMLAAGALARAGRPASAAPVAAVALVLGIAAGLHGLGAALVETGVETRQRARAAARLLPWDARPWATVAPERACATDPDDPVLARLHGGCR